MESQVGSMPNTNVMAGSSTITQMRATSKSSSAPMLSNLFVGLAAKCPVTGAAVGFNGEDRISSAQIIVTCANCALKIRVLLAYRRTLLLLFDKTKTPNATRKHSSRVQF